MFILNVHGEDFALRPMSCPFHFALYKRKPRSYKELPLRYTEIASLFRNEQSGELRGLTRVRQFTLADAHIICTPEQVEEEFKEVLNLIDFIMKTLGIEVWYQFSRWDPKNKDNKYIDNPKAWNSTEKSMKKILDKLKIKYIEKKDEAAFYGPKLDLQYKDVYGKEDTIITLQIDFANSDSFNLTYKDENGNDQVPTIIHRSSTGATERVISYLLEKTQGNLPLWLSPVQVKILSMNEEQEEYAKEIKKKLTLEGIRCELDISNESIGKKARNAIIEKAFYLATVGSNEKEEGKVALRGRDSNNIDNLLIEEFIKKLKEEISKKQ